MIFVLVIHNFLMLASILYNLSKIVYFRTRNILSVFILVSMYLQYLQFVLIQLLEMLLFLMSMSDFILVCFSIIVLFVRTAVHLLALSYRNMGKEVLISISGMEALISWKLTLKFPREEQQQVVGSCFRGKKI